MMLRQFIFFFILCLPSFGLVAQTDITGQCVGPRINLSGFHNTMTAQVQNAACVLRSVLPSEFQAQFKVFEHDLLPLMGKTNPTAGYEQAKFHSITAVESSVPFYVLIIKEFDAESNIRFIVKVKLPRTGVFATLQTAQEQALAALGESTMRGRSEVPGTEAEIAVVSGLNAMTSALMAIVAGQNPFQDLSASMLESIGFQVLVGSVKLEATGNGVGNDFAGLIYDFGGSVGKKSILQFFPEGVSSFSFSILPILTHTANFNSAGKEFDTALQTFDTDQASEVIIWLHYKEAGQGQPGTLYWRWKLNASEEELATRAQREFENTFPEIPEDDGEDVRPFRENSNPELRDDCSWASFFNFSSSWHVGARIKPCAAQHINKSLHHPTGFALGVVDGVMDLLQMLYDAFNPFSEENKHNIFSAAYWLDLVDKVSTKGVYQGLKTKLYDDLNYWKNFWKETVENIKALFGIFTNKTLFLAMCEQIYRGAEAYVGNLLLLSGETIDAGYKLGKLVFEVVLAFFTGGAKTVASLSKTLIKQFLVEWKSIKNASALANKALEYIGKAWNDSKTGAARLRCILRGACFLGTTPVHLYQQIMPIRDIPINPGVNALLQARRLQAFTPTTFNAQN